MVRYNFSAGPTGLPEPVKSKVLECWENWEETGFSFVEVSHRHPKFQAMIAHCEARLKDLLNIPDDYAILFLHGGARTQFATLPLNLMGKCKKANYILSGYWSKQAADEARQYGEIREIPYIENGKENREVLSQLDNDVAYTHFVMNETIDGVEIYDHPSFGGAPLVADMSSTLLSRTFDITQYGVVYACAQKNLGIAGVTIVVIKKSLLDQAMPEIPSVFSFKKQADYHSCYNTPPTFSLFVMSVILDWIYEIGLKTIEAQNIQKAEMLYRCIDDSSYLRNDVEPSIRSRMNVPFHLINENETDVFLQEAESNGFCFLNGHKVVGGCRASIYNAFPLSGLEGFVNFVKEGYRKSPI